MKRSCTCSNLRELEEYKGSAAEFDLDDEHHPRVKRQNSGLPRLMGSASVSGGLGFKHSPPLVLAPHHHRPLDTSADGPLGLPPRSPTASPKLQPQAQPHHQHQLQHQGLLARVESARLEFSVAAASCALAATSVPGTVVTTKAAVLAVAATTAAAASVLAEGASMDACLGVSHVAGG